MAKYEVEVERSLQEILSAIRREVSMGKSPAQLEESFSFERDGCSVSVQIYEKYYLRLNSNRALTLTLVSTGENQTAVCAIVAGGQSGLMGFSMGTDNDLLDVVKRVCEPLRKVCPAKD